MSGADAAYGACPAQAGSEQVRRVLASRAVGTLRFIERSPTCCPWERELTARRALFEGGVRLWAGTGRREKPALVRAPVPAAAAPKPAASRRSPAADRR